MKSITIDGEEYDLDVQGAIAILEHTAFVAGRYSKLLYGEDSCLYTQKEILDSIDLLKKEVA